MRYLSIFVVVLSGIAQAAEPAVWPQWRGPTRDGVVTGADWPDTLQGESLKQLWRVEMGPSYSGPIIAGDRVFTTETRDKTEEVVRALDRKTGKELWNARWKGSITVPFFAKRNGDWIRATPVHDGEALYVGGIRDLFVCLEGKDGKERWRVDFAQRYKTEAPAFGCVSSPLVDGDFVYVQAATSFVKINKKTGETVWRCLEEPAGTMGGSFSSPQIATLRGRRQFLVQTRTRLAGVNPEDGKVLWSSTIPAHLGMNILTPTPLGDSVFTSAHTGKSLLLKIDKEGDRFEPKEVWNNKLQGYMSTPVVVGGHAYLLQRGRNDKKQPMSCIDLKTGDVKWTSEADFGEYASLVVQKDRILALDNRGTLYLLKANPEKCEILDSRRVTEEETWAHLAVCGDEIFIRELKAMTAYRWRK